MPGSQPASGPATHIAADHDDIDTGRADVFEDRLQSRHIAMDIV
jgi:hypothetical protein